MGYDLRGINDSWDDVHCYSPSSCHICGCKEMVKVGEAVFEGVCSSLISAWHLCQICYNKGWLTPTVLKGGLLEYNNMNTLKKITVQGVIKN